MLVTYPGGGSHQVNATAVYLDKDDLMVTTLEAKLLPSRMAGASSGVGQRLSRTKTMDDSRHVEVCICVDCDCYSGRIQASQHTFDDPHHLYDTGKVAGTRCC